MLITKSIGFEAGHRLPNHQSKFKNIHGHHYELEVTVEGPIDKDPTKETHGMVMDFGDLKQIIKDEVVSPWDHAFFVYEGDTEVFNFLNTLDNHKTVVTPYPPTAEFLAQLAFDKIKASVEKNYGTHLTLKKIKLYETPTSIAEVTC